MNKVSDDKLPMTGTWYRSTAQHWKLGKVVTVEHGIVTMATSTGSWIGDLTSFASDWELS